MSSDTLLQNSTDQPFGKPGGDNNGRLFNSDLDNHVASLFGWHAPMVPKILTVEDAYNVLHKRSKGRVATKAEASLLYKLLISAVNSAPKQVGLEGIGLSAVQIGLLIRGFVAFVNNKWELFLDPHIKVLDDNIVYMLEGCLSIPDVEVIVGRYKKIEVQYYNLDLERKKAIFKGYSARVILHEFDHLEGVLITDRGKTKK